MNELRKILKSLDEGVIGVFILIDEINNIMEIDGADSLKTACFEVSGYLVDRVYYLAQKKRPYFDRQYLSCPTSNFKKLREFHKLRKISSWLVQSASFHLTSFRSASDLKKKCWKLNQLTMAKKKENNYFYRWLLICIYTDLVQTFTVVSC